MKMWWGGLALRSFNKVREGKVFCWVTVYLGVVLHCCLLRLEVGAFQVAQYVKNLPAMQET